MSLGEIGRAVADAAGMPPELSVDDPLQGVPWASTLPVVQHVMQDAPFPAVILHVPLQVDARAANNWEEAH